MLLPLQKSSFEQQHSTSMDRPAEMEESRDLQLSYRIGPHSLMLFDSEHFSTAVRVRVYITTCGFRSSHVDGSKQSTFTRQY
jgi:hypothetical protein